MKFIKPNLQIFCMSMIHINIMIMERALNVLNRIYLVKGNVSYAVYWIRQVPPAIPHGHVAHYAQYDQEHHQRIIRK